MRTDASVLDAPAIGDASVSGRPFDAGPNVVRDAGDPRTPLDATVDSRATSPRPTALRADFTTLPQGGKFSPHNIGAAWIEDANGRWVHTLELWTAVFGKDLTSYVAAGGPPFGPGFFMNAPVPPDVIVSATLPSHRSHHDVWNLLDQNGVEVPDGRYQLVVEVAEDRNGGVLLQVAFDKGDKPFAASLPDTTGYSNVSLSLL